MSKLGHVYFIDFGAVDQRAARLVIARIAQTTPQTQNTDHCPHAQRKGQIAMTTIDTSDILNAQGCSDWNRR